MWHNDGPGFDVVPEIYYSANFYAEAAIEAITSHAKGEDAANPFFLYYAIQNVHSPYTLPPAWETHSYPALWDHTYSNMIHMMDDMVGNLTDALKDTGAWDHTLVVFTADNGGIGKGNNHGLRGHKHDPWQGGTRATAFISGGFVPANIRGTNSGAKLVHISDWYATFSALAGAVSADPVHVTDSTGQARVADIDGVNVWPLLTGTNLTQPRRLTPTTEASIFDTGAATATPSDSNSDSDSDATGIGSGSGGGNGSSWWKLVTLAGQSNYYAPNQSSIKPTDPCLAGKQDDPKQPGRTDAIVTGCPVCNATSPCLYDILNDPMEQHNLAAQHPDVVASLAAALDKTLAYYTQQSLSAAELAKYEKIPNGTWENYLGPCYRRKNKTASSGSGGGSSGGSGGSGGSVAVVGVKGQPQPQPQLRPAPAVKLGPPKPPASLAKAFTAHFRLHSASPMAQGSYFEGTYTVDVDAGLRRETGLNWEGVGCTDEDSLTLCPSSNGTNLQVYVSNETTGCDSIALPNCPVMPPYSITSDATWVQLETVNGVSCDKWSFYDPAAGSMVEAWTMKMSSASVAPPLVRYVGNRVQHDFTNISLTVPSSSDGKTAVDGVAKGLRIKPFVGGGALGAMTSLRVVLYYLVKMCRDERFRQPPHDALFAKSLFDFIFGLLFVIQGLDDRLMTRPWTTDPDDPYQPETEYRLCTTYGVMLQFLFICGESCFILQMTDLFRALQNPFASHSFGKRLVLYLRIMFFAAVVSCAFLVKFGDGYDSDPWHLGGYGYTSRCFCGPRWRPYNWYRQNNKQPNYCNSTKCYFDTMKKWCNVPYAKTDNKNGLFSGDGMPLGKFDPLLLARFVLWYLWIFGAIILGIYTYWWARKRLRGGLKDTFQARAAIIKATKIKVFYFTMYWVVWFTVYAVLPAASTPCSDNSSCYGKNKCDDGSDCPLTSKPYFPDWSFIFAAKGFVDWIAWMRIKYFQTPSVEEMPPLNSALRKEVLGY
eukprot:g2256.t1